MFHFSNFPETKCLFFGEFVSLDLFLQTGCHLIGGSLFQSSAFDRETMVITRLSFLVMVRFISTSRFVQNFCCFWGFSIYISSKITVFRKSITVIFTVALLQSSWFPYNSSHSTQIILLFTHFWYAFRQLQRKSCLRNMWNTN